MLKIMFNEVRKYRLAMGMLSEDQISAEERKTMMISSIELR